MLRLGAPETHRTTSRIATPSTQPKRHQHTPALQAKGQNREALLVASADRRNKSIIPRPAEVADQVLAKI